MPAKLQARPSDEETAYFEQLLDSAGVRRGAKASLPPVGRNTLSSDPNPSQEKASVPVEIAHEPSVIAPRSPQEETETDTREDAMASRVRLVGGQTSSDVVKMRASYSLTKDKHCLPQFQRYALVTSFGLPDTERDMKSDVDADENGIRVWGVFETLDECAQHGSYIRERNPYAAFLPLRTIDLHAGITFCQLPQNEQASQSAMSKNNRDGENTGPSYRPRRDRHVKAMKEHLAEEVSGVENIDKKAQITATQSARKNLATRRLNQCIDEVRKEMPTYQTSPEAAKEQEALALKTTSHLQPMEFGDNITPEILDKARTLSSELKSIPALLVKPQLALAKIEQSDPGPDFRYSYKTLMIDGKPGVYRCLERLVVQPAHYANSV